MVPGGQEGRDGNRCLWVRRLRVRRLVQRGDGRRRQGLRSPRGGFWVLTAEGKVLPLSHREQSQRKHEASGSRRVGS